MEEVSAENSESAFVEKQSFINKRKVILFVAFLLVVWAVSYYFYSFASIVTVGDVSYTYSDVNRVYKVEQWIGDILGSSIVKSKSDVLYNLVLAGIKKEILRKNNISISSVNAIQIMESRTILKGLYAKIKNYLDDDYFRLFIEPMAVDDTFAAFFTANEPQRKVANSIHQDALKIGLSEAAKKTDRQVVEVFIPLTQRNTDFISKIKEVKDQVYNAIVETDTHYSIVKLKDVKDNGVVVDSIVVNKKTMREFLKNEMKAVPINLNLHSWYREKDLKKKEGSIF